MRLWRLLLQMDTSREINFTLGCRHCTSTATEKVSDPTVLCVSHTAYIVLGFFCSILPFFHSWPYPLKCQNIWYAWILRNYFSNWHCYDNCKKPHYSSTVVTWGNVASASGWLEIREDNLPVSDMVKNISLGHSMQQIALLHCSQSPSDCSQLLQLSTSI